MKFTYKKVTYSLAIYWEVMDTKGEYFATTLSEDAAILIVSSLNACTRNWKNEE